MLPSLADREVVVVETPRPELDAAVPVEVGELDDVDLDVAALPDDPEHRERVRLLVEEHLGLADHIARRMRPPSVAREDFVQVARLGLVQAAHRYDPERGVPFAGYASAVVSGRLKHYLRDLCWDIRVPRALQETWLRTGPVRETLTQKLGRAPTVAELAAEMGVDEEHLLEAMPVGDAWTVTRFEGMGVVAEEGAWEPKDARDFYAAADDRMWLRSALTTLPERLQWILQMYYVEELPQRVIAEQIGVSQMQVSRLLARSLVLLRSQAS